MNPINVDVIIYPCSTRVFSTPNLDLSALYSAYVPSSYYYPRRSAAELLESLTSSMYHLPLELDIYHWSLTSTIYHLSLSPNANHRISRTEILLQLLAHVSNAPNIVEYRFINNVRQYRKMFVHFWSLQGPYTLHTKLQTSSKTIVVKIIVHKENCRKNPCSCDKSCSVKGRYLHFCSFMLSVWGRLEICFFNGKEYSYNMLGVFHFCIHIVTTVADSLTNERSLVNCWIRIYNM